MSFGSLWRSYTRTARTAGACVSSCRARVVCRVSCACASWLIVCRVLCVVCEGGFGPSRVWHSVVGEAMRNATFLLPIYERIVGPVLPPEVVVASSAHAPPHTHKPGLKCDGDRWPTDRSGFGTR
jgi:hypothetical protein